MRLPGLALVVLAAPAQALTCAPPDLQAAMRRAIDAQETYRVLRGRLDFDDRLLPPPVAPGTAPPPSLAPVPATLTGEALGARGWAPATAAVTVQPACAGPWCGWIPSGEAWLLIARAEEGALVVEVGPCGGWAFMDPTPAQGELARACVLEGC